MIQRLNSGPSPQRGQRLRQPRPRTVQKEGRDCTGERTSYRRAGFQCKNQPVAGRFKVAGTFRVTGRGRIVYGDIASGEVISREGLLVPLGGGTTLAVGIRSIESMDSPDRSFVALPLQANEELETALLEGLTLEGRELEVAPLPGRTTFPQAVERLRNLLRAMGWPEEVTWVPPSHVIRYPHHVYVFRPESSIASRNAAHIAFDSAADTCVAVRVGAIGRSGATTFAAVWPIHELGDGEEMFIEDGVKVNAPAEDLRVTIVRSRIKWRLTRWLYESWCERQDAALRAM